VLLGAEGEGVYVDTRIGVTGVVLEGLDYIEVGSLTLREAVLAIELELGGDYRVLTPAVQLEGSLSKDEGAGIGDEGALVLCDIGLIGKGKVAGCVGNVAGPALALGTTKGTI